MNNNKITPRLSDIDSAMNQRNIPNAAEVFNSQPVIKDDIVPRRSPILAKLPDDAIIRHDDKTLSIGRFILADYGLEVPEDAELFEFENAFTIMFKVSEQIGLWIGDALAEFERLKHGSVDAIAAYFGIANGTVSNWKSRSVSVKLSRRRENLLKAQAIDPGVNPLSPSHYSAIASLNADDQDELMMMALLDGWSVRQMRKAVKSLKASNEIREPSKYAQIDAFLTKAQKWSMEDKIALYEYLKKEIEHLLEG